MKTFKSLSILALIFSLSINCGNTDSASDESSSATTTSTSDTTSPVVGNSGTITIDGFNKTAVTIKWTKATDTTSTQANLQYLAYYSTSNNLNTISNVESNGTAAGVYTNDILLKEFVGLTPGTTYYFNIIVKDEAGNKAIYTTKQQATQTDTANPNVATSTIIFSNITKTSVNINWVKATDDTTSQANLRYLAYYSTSNNIDTVTNIEANGTAIGTYANDILIKNVTGLTSGLTYYFNIIVKDISNNKKNYSQTLIVMLNSSAPTVGSSGAISFSGITATSITVNWAKANDDTSSQANLQYLAYYSISNNIDSIANIEANGTTIGTYATDIITKNSTGLTTGGKVYYFNLIVKDEAGNKAGYVMANSATADSIIPVLATGSANVQGFVYLANFTTTSITLSWDKATDAPALQSNLQYLVYTSATNNISSISDIETNGTAFSTYSTNINTKNVSGIPSSNSYYVNLIVKDPAGNKKAYLATQVTQCRATAAATMKTCFATSPPPFHQDCRDAYTTAITACVTAGN